MIDGGYSKIIGKCGYWPKADLWDTPAKPENEFIGKPYNHS